MKTEPYMMAVRHRRTIHALGKDADVSEERIEELVKEAVLHAPSEFNSQNARAVIVFGEQHEKLWDIARESLREALPEETFAAASQRMDMFRVGVGTVLFYRDQQVVEDLQQRFPAYRDEFPVWAEQSAGMLQVIVWTALAAEGLGASLQHYNSHIEERARTEWDIPTHWKLVAQMPFGRPMQAPREKNQVPVEDRVRIIR